MTPRHTGEGVVPIRISPRTLLGSAVLTANLATAVLALLAPTLAEAIAPASMRPEAGHNTTASVSIPVPFPYVVPWDTGDDPHASDGVVTEDERPLGPGHALHEDIRTLGGGRYSLWAGSVYFSSSDGTDPATNGRAYALEAASRLPRRIVFGLLALDLAALPFFLRTLLAFACRRSASLAGLAVAAFAARVLAAMAGLASPFPVLAGDALDPALATAVALHLLLGLGLAAAVWAAGAGLLLWGGRGGADLDDLTLRAFLPGAALAGLAALAAVALPHGSLLGLALGLAAAAPVVRVRPDTRALVRLLRPFLLCGPFVLGFAAVLAFRFHGPSATLAGSPVGDTTIYVGISETLTQRLVPLYNYANEGFRRSYANLLPSLLATPLLRVPGFDPYLFFAASLPVLGLAWLAVALPALSRAAARIGEPAPGWLHLAALGLLMLGMMRSPSLIPGSPPFVFLFPVVVATVHYALLRGQPGRAAAVASLGTALSKVVAFGVLVPIALPTLARHLLRRVGPAQRVFALACGVAVAAYVAFSFWVFLPGFLALELFGPASVDAFLHGSAGVSLAWACLLARDVGVVLLGAAVTRVGLSGLALGVWTGALAYLAIPFLFYTSLTAAMLAVAAAIAARPSAFLGRMGPILFAGVLLALPQTLGSEGDGGLIAAAWCAAVLSIAAALALDAAERRPEAARETARLRWSAAAGGAGLLLVALLGAGAGALRLGPEGGEFTPDLRDVWRAVRDATPPDALIFTDQTGETETRTGGWDDFALLARRQFFLASWEVTPLRNDPLLKRRWLDTNAGVLAGRLSPQALPLSRHYGSFYAVIEAARPAPAGSELLYANRSYRLLRLPTSD